MIWQPKHRIWTPRNVGRLGLGLSLGLGSKSAPAAAAAAGGSYLIDLPLTDGTGITQKGSGSFTFDASGATFAGGNGDDAAIISDAEIDDSTELDWTVSLEWNGGTLGMFKAWCWLDSAGGWSGATPNFGFYLAWDRIQDKIVMGEQESGFSAGRGTAYDPGRSLAAGDVIGLKMTYNSGTEKWKPVALLNDVEVITDSIEVTKNASHGTQIGTHRTGYEGGSTIVKNLRAASNA